jgi:hypothetical protein
MSRFLTSYAAVFDAGSMIEPGSKNPVEMQVVKAGRGRDPFLLFARAPRVPGNWKTMVSSGGWVQAAFGMLLCFTGFMIVALVVGYLRGRI